MDGFASQIDRVVTSIRPLADEMNKVAAGFSAFPFENPKAYYPEREIIYI